MHLTGHALGLLPGATELVAVAAGTLAEVSPALGWDLMRSRVETWRSHFASLKAAAESLEAVWFPASCHIKKKKVMMVKLRSNCFRS